MIKALSNTSIEALVNDRVVLEVLVADDSGNLVDDIPDFTVTSPSEVVTSVAGGRVATGVYSMTLTGLSEGRYVIEASAPNRGSTLFAVYVSEATTAGGMPTASDVDDYMGGDANHSYTMDEIQAALKAEASAQRKRCNVGAVYPPDLAEALKRRVHRHLAMKGVVLPTDMMGDAGAGNSGYLPWNDPEIKRLESPYRKVILI